MKLLRAVLFLPLLGSCSPGLPARTAAKALEQQVHRVAEKPHPAPAKPPRPPKPKPPARPALPTYQCLFNDEHLAHLRVAMDRSGKKAPIFEYSTPVGGDVTGLHWQDAPAGMEYHEEILGTWHGRQIVSSSYRGASGSAGSQDVTECFLSLEDQDHVLRPFLQVTKEAIAVFELEHHLTGPSDGELTGSWSSWQYSGSGVFWVNAHFLFQLDGAHLMDTSYGGRKMPTERRTYNSAGKVVRVRKDKE